MHKTDITGERFGNLVVLGKCDPIPGKKNSRWLCRCDCGRTSIVSRCSLITGHTKTCGDNTHKKGANSTHGLSKTRLYQEWLSMKRRCLPNSQDSKTYFRRGITVCTEWLSDFIAFRSWAIANGYADNLSLDRVDNDKGYSPDNCRWVPIALQQSNKSNTTIVEYEGQQHCLRTLCEEIGFPYKTAHRRYMNLKRRGKSIDTSILFAPIDKSKIPLRYRKD